MLVSLLASYYKTRHRLTRLGRIFSVKPHERVLDIGSGDSPFAPADMLCEKFPWDDYERTGHFRHDRPLVVGDIEALPFKDKAFDFIHCSHVLEHVFHPEKAIAELLRVGRRGYIEMPSSYFEKAVRSYPGHLWFVSLEQGTLVFRPKPRGVVDQELIDTVESRLMDKDPSFSAYFYSRFYSLFTIGFWWEGAIPYRVESPAGAREAFTKGSTDLSHSDVKPERAGGLASVLKNWVKTRASRAKQFVPAEALACPLCRGGLESQAATWQCPRCHIGFPARDGVPILLPEAAKPLPGYTSDIIASQN